MPDGTDGEPVLIAAGRARPADLVVVRAFLLGLVILLAGYMFMGRGFAHLGFGRIYVGEVVLALGLIAVGAVIVRVRPSVRSWRIEWLLAAFMVLGAARTLPYLGTYGADALRDGVLWGYGLFALIVVLVVDRRLVGRAVRFYSWIVPVFAVWLPICWLIFNLESEGADPSKPGSFTPIVFFKATDMAAHAAGVVAFLVLAVFSIPSIRAFIWRAVMATPLAWTAYITATVSRAALLASILSYGAAAVFTQNRKNWAPIAMGFLLVAAALLVPPFVATAVGPGILPTPTPPSSATPTSASSPGAETSAPATPEPTQGGRAHDPAQVVDNLVSVFTKSEESNLEGTKQFRLAWWKAIVKYTVTGPYFWTGKGFGINLADADGFQPTADHSLRAPHNSHLSVLARMGVPGFALWALMQGLFAIGLLRAVVVQRRIGDRLLATTGSWILVYWVSMMLITSFDPYLEGPQGGIWFWVLFGLGLVVIRSTPKRTPG